MSHKLFLAFGIALASVIDASVANAKAAMPSSLRAIYEQNIRDGFSAKAGFELVTIKADRLDHSFPNLWSLRLQVTLGRNLSASR